MNRSELMKYSKIETFTEKEDIVKAWLNGNSLWLLTKKGSIHLLSNGTWHKYLPCNLKDFVVKGNKALALSREGFLLSHSGIATVNNPKTQPQTLTRDAWGNPIYSSSYSYSTQNQTAAVPTVERNFHLVDRFKGIVFLKIAMEEDRYFALAQDGGLYEWTSAEYNRYELDWSLYDDIEPESKTVKHILCTKKYPIVLTRNGRVFIPEDSSEVVSNVVIHRRKLQIFGETLRTKKVVDLVVENKFSSALTDSGEIYIWKTENAINETPQMINYTCHKNQSLGKKLWVAGTKNLILILLESGRYISVIFSDDGEVLAKSIVSSRSAFHFFKDCDVQFNGCLYDAVKNTEYRELKSLWMSKLKEIFDEKEGSDLIIDVQGKSIYCHKSFVSAQCDYLKTWIRNEEMKGNVDENMRLSVKDFEYETVYSILNYFYTGRLEFSSLNITMELIELTNIWTEDELQKFCVDEAIQCLSMENVHCAMEIAHKLEIKELKEACCSLNPDLEC